ncbi:MAG: 50S ribosomal protein L6 [Candidatus Cloacimonetes bacterium]|nr:50S ribosomal protein L6 [Candidatus Cloacimonadota bacterium]
MSRIGRIPIKIPAAVKVEINKESVSVSGPKGKLSYNLKPGIIVENKAGEILVNRSEDTRELKAFHGLTRALLNNMVTGVTEGYLRILQVIGTGYSAERVGPWLKLTLGYSHDILIEIPEGITVEAEAVPRRDQGALGVQSLIRVSGINKEDVGKFAAEIRACRPPAPNFKGKGIRWLGEHVRIVSKAGTA